MLNKTVQIVKGEFKGQIGRVTHVNGPIASLEISTRAKQINIALVDLKECPGKSGNQGGSRQGGRAYQGPGGQHGQGGPHGSTTGGGDQTDAGGQAAYGGQTVYDGGKTTYAALNTPAHGYMNTMQDGNYTDLDQGRGPGDNDHYNAQETNYGSDYGYVGQGGGNTG